MDIYKTLLRPILLYRAVITFTLFFIITYVMHLRIQCAGS